MPISLSYDPATDALRLRLADTAVVESEEVRPGVVLDYDANNRVVSIEFLHLSKQSPDADLKTMVMEVA